MTRTSLLLALLAAGPGTALGRTTHVEPGRDTLKDAVAQASPGDTLRLSAGLYQVTSTVVIDKDLTIEGRIRDRRAVHIAAVEAEEFNFEELKFPDPLDRGHILFVTDGAQNVTFRYFTIKNAPETDISIFECEESFGLNHTECFGDGIHADGAANLEVAYVQASLNAGNGIYVNGAVKANFYRIVAVNNGAFGIDIDTALGVTIRKSNFIANQVSGVEASGHEPGTLRADYRADIEFEHVLGKGNGEIGLEVERFENAILRRVICSDNREDGFDADRVHRVVISDSDFIRNLDDGIEMFPAGDGVPPDEQPDDFPGSIIEEFMNLGFAANAGEDIERPPTED
jgi:hypothetical protein